MRTPSARLSRSLGTWEVTVAGVALVVAASTLVSDFTGFFTLGIRFALALGLGFLLNVLLAISAADLAVAYPRAGTLYAYARAVLGEGRGERIGVFLGLTFFGMFGLASAGEVTAGAAGLRALMDGAGPLNVYIVLITALAVVPNLFGIRTAAWVTAALMIVMLGIRWGFGIAGFLGLGATGAWSLANLDAGPITLFGPDGVIQAGLALAFWSFVGIEFACGLAEEVRVPAKAIPRGLLLGLAVILTTSLVMGLGVTGTAPLSLWQGAARDALGCGGDCPQIAVGHLMFGQLGEQLMAIASLAATLGTLTIAYAAMPRLLYAMARGWPQTGTVLSRLARPLGRVSARRSALVVATWTTFVLYLTPALFSGAVIDWMFSAAYVWVLLYIVFHALALRNRRVHPSTPGAFGAGTVTAVSAIGIVLTLASLYVAFAEAHLWYGARALVVLGSAALVTALLFARRGNSANQPKP